MLEVPNCRCCLIVFMVVDTVVNPHTPVLDGSDRHIVVRRSDVKVDVLIFWVVLLLT
jgi:hypothetical protein